MNHQIGRWLFALAVGLVAAWYSYQWITNPVARVERQLEEAVVMAAREQLLEQLFEDPEHANIELVDPLAPNRRVGKVYVFRADDGWEVSGHYRRNEDDRWHPYLMRLDGANTMTFLKVQDAAVMDAAAENELVEVLP